VKFVAEMHGITQSTAPGGLITAVHGTMTLKEFNQSLTKVEDIV
jgi:hypothetical protein